ncbi:YppG family protein [Shouchella shacheensis]|uniref:YppG family protein n=1 Tax=Shouchella shacheensis TaxID=1649580 RepID=UPI00074045E6|nr:YppG family protein [Shouchella shacheensis]
MFHQPPRHGFDPWSHRPFHPPPQQRPREPLFGRRPQHFHGRPLSHQHLPFHHHGQQAPGPKERKVWAVPFTNEEGKFDIGRTTTSVDKFMKTFQQVSPYVKKAGSFFIR